MKSAPFEIQLKTRSKGMERVFTFRSAEGVESPRNILPEEVLLLQGSKIENTDAVLCVDSRVGVSACVLGSKASAGRTMMTESNARTCLISELNRRKNDVSSAEVMLSCSVKDDCIRKFDVATYIPRKRDPDHVIKQKLYDSIQVLREDGRLYFCTGKKHAEKFLDFLDGFGELTQKVKNDQILIELTEPEKIRRNSFVRQKRLEHSIKGENCRFKTLEGNFSAEKLNLVEMLSRELEVDENDSLLDLDADFGGVGVFASKLYNCSVSFTERECQMAEFIRDNCELNEVENFDVLVEDGAENFDLAEFDAVTYIVDGSRSSEVIESDIHDCRRVLKEGGKLYVGHSKEFNAESVVRKVFGDAKAQRREVDYQVTSVVK